MEKSTVFQGLSIFPSNITNTLPAKLLQFIASPQTLNCQKNLSLDKSIDFLKKSSDEALDLSYFSTKPSLDILDLESSSKIIENVKYFAEPLSADQLFKLQQTDNKITTKLMPDSTASIVLKPPHSYIGLIAMAILSGTEQQKTLSEIYEWIAENYPYFRWRGTGWRNSIRHNLSLNDCFVKANRASNGKGHYWAIHPVTLKN